MAKERVERRLAAILAADVAGYSRLMGADEEGTLAALKTIRRELGDPKIAEHRGRIVKTTGDGLLVEFPSVVDAVRCAVEVQQAMAEQNAEMPPDKRIQFRIGINLGDIIIDEHDIFGDGVNVAARLEALAEPGGICISRMVHDQVQDRLDLAFEDMGEQQVKNIARPVHVFRIRPPLTHPVAGAPGSPLSRPAGEGAERQRREAGEGSPPARALPDKPSLAVLPFQNMTGDPEQEYFVDGMVEEITTAISRLPWLFVIARNSSFTYKGRAVDVKQVARELGVRYVLEGSVRKAGNRVRITGQLIDTATGAHIWADRFDGALDDIFELQDQVAASVAGVIEPKLRQSEIERASRKPTEDLSAYDFYLRAVAESHKADATAGAIAFARQALAIDPLYAPAASMIGWLRHVDAMAGVQLSGSEVAEALSLTRKAIESGKDDPEVLWRSAASMSLLAGERAAAIRIVERALALNPSSASAWFIYGGLHCQENRPSEAMDAIRRAMRLSPLDPLLFSMEWVLGHALMLAGRFEDAIERIDRSLQDRPSFHAPIRCRIALCGYLGRTDEAREWIARLLALNPFHTVAWYKVFGGRFLSPGALAVWVEGLRLAGLPEV
jgi:TolB-like protein/class 3 adenylate cyclase/Flp pilus assembly protein TadD